MSRESSSRSQLAESVRKIQEQDENCDGEESEISLVIYKHGSLPGWYHTRIAVNNIEYYYSYDGIEARQRKQREKRKVLTSTSKLKFVKIVPFGKIRKSARRIGEMMISLNNGNWGVATYHKIHRNCCTFSREILKRYVVERYMDRA